MRNMLVMCEAKHLRRRGFTFLELSIGMVVTAMVLAALAAFSLATASTWNSGQTTNTDGSKTIAAIPVIGTLACVRLDNEFSSAYLTGGYYPGTLTSSSGQQASILLWKKDTTNTGTIDTSEIYLIEYDATNHVINKWSPSGTSTPVAYDDFKLASYITEYKKTALKEPLARNVDGMQLYVQTPTSLTQLPLVEYRLYFSRAGRNQTRYGAICLRSPTKPNDLTLN
jgi:prepilin-type N-terminal cleavage/methylation domain-containing protein